MMPLYLGYLQKQRGVLAKKVQLHLGSATGSCCLVGFIRGQQGCIDWLHAGWAGEGTHQPGIDAIHVVDVKAGQESNGITIFKIHHADYTFFNFLVRWVRAWVKDASGQVLDETDALSDADLLLFS